MTTSSYIISLLLLYFCLLLPQTQDIQFEHITMDDGLSNDYVYCILKDRRGFMWFGTGSGLDRYEGYNIITLKHGLANTNSIISSTLHAEDEIQKNYMDNHMSEKIISIKTLTNYLEK